MKMDVVAGSRYDEYFTPKYAVVPIKKYVVPGSVVWCPFDEPGISRFSHVLGGWNTVVCTHKNSGNDFFTTEPPAGCDYIISNPPYSLKSYVFERLFELKIPFAMLVGVVGLFESRGRFKMFQDNSWEIMYLNKRVSYMTDPYDARCAANPPFSSVYLCSGMLPERIVFDEVNPGEGV